MSDQLWEFRSALRDLLVERAGEEAHRRVDSILSGWISGPASSLALPSFFYLQGVGTIWPTTFFETYGAAVLLANSSSPRRVDAKTSNLGAVRADAIFGKNKCPRTYGQHGLNPIPFGPGQPMRSRSRQLRIGLQTG